MPDRTELQGDEVVELVPAVGGGGQPDPAARGDLADRMLEGGGRHIGSLTVAENIRAAAGHAALAGCFEIFSPLEPRRDVWAALLSGGEQMLIVAQALACRPKVLMLDERSQALARS